MNSLVYIMILIGLGVLVYTFTMLLNPPKEIK